MALLSFRGFDTPSLPAQGEQRLPPIFNIQRGNALRDGLLTYREHILEGLAAAPDAIALLYRGENTGKLLIRVD